ncbi:uncharacterized protein LOC125663022 isoform X2 [Ostrea edulis]|uniref:uncharacterized protein LOC125663022 isoform X2 n=1 Tax=Ostrea edulis TaxID=37623 RepID=UPI0024AF1F04|nr:uncharacterized protein LOC125663022 isoform X2 [Ostrea edulis]
MDDCKLTCETKNQIPSENMGKEDTENEEEEEDIGDMTHSSVIDTDYINSHMNSVIGALAKIMNCKISECDEADHVRHHMFVRNPTDMYEKYIKQYFFGRKFISAVELEHLQTILHDEMFCSKPLHGSISTRYRTFQNLNNEELENILRDYPLYNGGSLFFTCSTEGGSIASYLQQNRITL